MLLTSAIASRATGRRNSVSEKARLPRLLRGPARGPRPSAARSGRRGRARLDMCGGSGGRLEDPSQTRRAMPIGRGRSGRAGRGPVREPENWRRVGPRAAVGRHSEGPRYLSNSDCLGSLRDRQTPSGLVGCRSPSCPAGPRRRERAGVAPARAGRLCATRVSGGRHCRGVGKL